MLGHNIHSQSFHPNLGGPGHDGPTWRGTKIEVHGPDHMASKGLAKYKRGFTPHPKATSIGRAGSSQLPLWTLVHQASNGQESGPPVTSPLSPSSHRGLQTLAAPPLSRADGFPSFGLSPTGQGLAQDNSEISISRMSKMSKQQARSPRISLHLGGQGSFCFPTTQPNVWLAANSS